LPLNGRRNFNGVLRGVREGKIRLSVDAGEFEFDLEAIDKARLVPSYELTKSSDRLV